MASPPRRAHPRFERNHHPCTPAHGWGEPSGTAREIYTLEFNELAITDARFPDLSPNEVELIRGAETVLGTQARHLLTNSGCNT